MRYRQAHEKTNMKTRREDKRSLRYGENYALEREKFQYLNAAEAITLPKNDLPERLSGEANRKPGKPAGNYKGTKRVKDTA